MKCKNFLYKGFVCPSFFYASLLHIGGLYASTYQESNLLNATQSSGVIKCQKPVGSSSDMNFYDGSSKVSLDSFLLEDGLDKAKEAR